MSLNTVISKAGVTLSLRHQPSIFIFAEHLLDLQSRLAPGLRHEEVVEDVGGESDGGQEPVSAGGRERLQEGGEHLGQHEQRHVGGGTYDTRQNLYRYYH